jgi:hypothetical protein
MPATRSRKRAAPQTQESPVAKKTRLSSRKKAEPKALEEDDFEFEEKIEDQDIIDLADTEDVPEDLKLPEKDNRVKLSAFQCVICMDDSTGLTVTHCGTSQPSTSSCF